MKPHQLTVLLGGLLLAGLLVGTHVQQGRLTELRRDVEARAAKQTDSAKVVASAAASPTPTSTSAALSDAEMKELLTLRRDVSQLRQQKPKLDKLRAENDRLRAAVANPPKPGSGDGLSGDFLVASKARFMGLATPADTLQSFLFAMRSRDTNALFQVLAPDTATKLASQMEQQGAAQFMEGMGAIPGFRIKSIWEPEHPDNTAIVELQFIPNDSQAVEKLSLERVNGEWKLKLP